MSVKASTTERRRAPRLTHDFPIAIQSGDVCAQTRVHNISASGAYCTVNQFIAPMTKVDLRFQLPETQTEIHCTGVVVRTAPHPNGEMQSQYDIAVFFSDIAERLRRKLAAYIEQRLPA